jgi:hypothetical protein
MDEVSGYRLVAVGVAAVIAATLVFVSRAAPAVATRGVLAGQTQISYGCPGPVRVGAPSCQPWHALPRARFAVARRAADGSVVPGTTRLVVSGATGQFALQLAPGSYTVTPLAQAHTRGGPTLLVHLRAAKTTTIQVRFQGFPMMA